jgi:hypothetical protein
VSSHTDISSLATFTCAGCGRTASALAAGGVPRGHCPSCLHSRHVEDAAGDCAGLMAPIAVAVLRSGDWSVIHRCADCDELTSSPVRADDNRLVLMRMAALPLAQPPFPLEAFGTL